MRTISLLLLVAFTALAETHRGNQARRAKRELLVRSKRRWVLSTLEITEHDDGPFPKEVSTMFNDKTHASGQTYRIRGMGVTEPPLGVFCINNHTGILYAKKAVDREQYDHFKIKFDILSRETHTEIDQDLSFNIQVKDINDNAPTFNYPRMKANVKENMAQGYLPVQLLVSDRDQRDTPNSQTTITMISQNPQEPRIELEQIHGNMGQLTFKGCFDYDKEKKYELIVKVTDHGTPALSSTAVVTLNILDSNSHPPTFREKKYDGEVLESTISDDILRIAVDDEDTPKSPGWRAKYTIIEGNEGGNYKIETDPDTNEGILSVIKGKDYEKTTLANLVVKVENEEPLYVCENNVLRGASTRPPAATVNITMKVIDVNDPPQYGKQIFNVYQKEGEESGKELYLPTVTDVDSDVSKIRHVLLEDPASWVAIDEKTGKITTTEKMDRESPFVDGDNIYKIIMGAIDDGEPPTTGTCTVLVHLGDVNDNTPRLVNGSVVMCGNKNNKVKVSAMDADANPFSGPFAFFMGGDDKTLTQRWKLDPAHGEEGGLVSLKTLPYGNYSVPLLIQDQQGLTGEDTLEVVVCDCGAGDVCSKRDPPSSSFGAPGIGMVFLGLLMFLLLLLLFMCQCGGKDMPMVQDEGNATLIKYNQEGGGSECKADMSTLLTPTSSMAVTDGLRMGNAQTAPLMLRDVNAYNSSAFPPQASEMTQDVTAYNSPALMTSNMTSLGMQAQRHTIRSQRGQSARVIPFMDSKQLELPGRLIKTQPITQPALATTRCRSHQPETARDRRRPRGPPRVPSLRVRLRGTRQQMPVTGSAVTGQPGRRSEVSKRFGAKVQDPGWHLSPGHSRQKHTALKATTIYLYFVHFGLKRLTNLESDTVCWILNGINALPKRHALVIFLTCYVLTATGCVRLFFTLLF